ncbi:MAG: hypothetical protein V3T72_06695 [Thermoanaerobaculia bacterium]
MAGFVSTLAPGIQDPIGSRAVVKISPNLRARASTGFLGTVADVPMFPFPAASFFLQGQWLIPDTRCFAGGIPTVSQTSIGQAYLLGSIPLPPMLTVQPDPRVKVF